MSLSLLKSSFFNNLDRASLSHLLKAGDQWSQSCLPVALWENTLIIATSEDTAPEKSISSPHIFVKANSTDLEKLYQELFPVEESSSLVSEANAPQRIPEMPDFDFSMREEKTDIPVSSSEPILPPPPPPPLQTKTEILENSSNPPSQEEDLEATRSFSIPPPPGMETTKADGTKHLEIFHQFFDKVMLMKVEGEVLKPTEMLGDWKLNEHSLQEISLQANSIFKIAKKTKEAYHGYVAPNPTNDSFFQTFNEGSIPEHVSVLPIVDKENFLGVIVGLGTNEKSKLISLNELYDLVSKHQWFGDITQAAA